MLRVSYTYLGQAVVAWMSVDTLDEMAGLPGFTYTILAYKPGWWQQ